MNIEIDELSTFPANIITLLEDNLEILSLSAQWDLDYPYLPISERLIVQNPYANNKNIVLNQLNQNLMPCNLIGYHCTRLTDEEIKNIMLEGMFPLSTDALIKKIKRVVTAGLLPQEVATYLLLNNLSHEEFRANRLFFVCGASILQNEGNVSKFFRGWGGEAIYNCHENVLLSWPIIKSLGKPCIIKTSLIPNQLGLWVNLGEKIIEAFLQNKGIRTSNNPQFDTLMRQHLPANQILDIITSDHAEFSKLTMHDGWRAPLN